MGGKEFRGFFEICSQTDTFRYSKFVRTPKYFVRPKVGRRVRTAQNRATRRFKKEAKSAPIPYEDEVDEEEGDEGDEEAGPA